jgi:Flp pilus assembly protein TadD
MSDSYTPQMMVESGIELARLGRREEAAEMLRQAAAAAPDSWQARHVLGNVLFELGRLEEAAEALRQAVALQPENGDSRYNLATVLWRLNQLEAAESEARQAAVWQPNNPEVYLLLGLILRRRKRPGEAAAANLRALALRPNWPEALNNLGNAWRELGDLDQAASAFRRALELWPTCAEAHNNLGAVLLVQGREEDAEASCRRALSCRPDDPETLSNLGSVLSAEGQWDQAAAILRQVLQQRPDYAQAHWQMAMILLARGQYEEGWKEYEWRWRHPDLSLGIRLSTPRWNGGSPGGGRMVIHTEQGLGDAIQFARFIPMVASRVGGVHLMCRRELLPLMGTLPGVERSSGDDEPAPPHDLHCPICSLPGLLGITLQNLPVTVPYLIAEPSLVSRWAEKLPRDGRRKVGLLWEGRTRPDPRRSVPAESLAPLAQIGGICWVSLQVGNAGVERPPGLSLLDFAGDLTDFGQTAALIQNLDLVVTIDSAVAHLAGALGKPAWVLLKSVPDWRWMLQRTDCPWYPTMRLFRQSRRGDWQSPVRKIVEALGST